MKLSKEYKKQLIKEYKQKERQKFEENLPIYAEKVKELQDYLEKALEEENCDNTFKNTIRWLKDSNYSDIKNIINLFEELGAYCDCEILYNIDLYN